jgi:hypothetical protein
LLYHFSEEPNIEIFSPRQSKVYPELKPAVWAIDKEHSAHYLFPRDCPRVIYWKANWTEESDIAAFFCNTPVDKIMVVENRWLKLIQNVRLFMYSFSAESFELCDGTAGYYISYKEVVPVNIELVENVMERILSGNVELRFTPSLYPIRNSVISSTLDFSIIRFSNALKE